MKEKEIKEEKKELEVSEAQETEQQEQQAEAPAQEQKQEEKDEKEHPVLDKVGAFGKKVGRDVKKAAPIAVAVIAGLGVGKLLGKVEAYNEVLGDSGNDNPELPGETTEPAEPVIEDAEFKEISSDEQSEE